MDALDLVREAVDAIRAHTLRSFLTLLGIIIGVMTIVGVVSLIAGLDGFVKQKVINLAPDVVIFTKFGIIRSREEFLDALKRKDIDWREYERVRDLATRAAGVAAQLNAQKTMKYRDRRLQDVNLHGTTANFGTIMNVDIAAGRYFQEQEERAGQPVAVIGWDVREELFGALDPIGRELIVGGLPCRVIGVVTKRGSLFGQNQDAEVYIPITAFQQHFGGRRSLDLFVQAAGGVAGVERSADEVRSILRGLRHTSFRAPDPFGVITSEMLQDLWRQISLAAFILLALVSSVSLGVGGVVIANIMLVSVLERTQEIGVRLAVGAREADIRRQFLLEAALLSLAGGLIGAFLGSAAASAAAGALSLPVSVTPGILAMGIGLSVVVGIIAGFWPAWNASRLSAVEALGAE